MYQLYHTEARRAGPRVVWETRGPSAIIASNEAEVGEGQKFPRPFTGSPAIQDAVELHAARLAVRAFADDGLRTGLQAVIEERVPFLRGNGPVQLG